MDDELGKESEDDAPQDTWDEEFLKEADAPEDACAYCGQCFGPDSVVVEKEVYGKKLRFCDEQCLNEYREKTNFIEPEDDTVHVEIEKDDDVPE